MNIASEPFFSWNTRRVVLPRTQLTVVQSGSNEAGDDSSGIASDTTVSLGPRTGRLLTYRDLDWGVELVLLFVGSVVGAADVPVRVVDEESVLIDGQRCNRPAEILVAATMIRDRWLTRRLSRHDVDHQLCTGGPVRDAVSLSGAVSVESEWSEPIAAA